MSEGALSPHVVALIHHIELNKAGWWERAVERLIIAALWLSGETLTTEAILDRLRSAFSLRLDAANVTKRIRALCESDTLVPLRNGTFKIAERSVKELEASIEECEGLAARVESKFVQLFKASCPAVNAPETWTLFNDTLLLPLIREMGARTYEFISGTRGDIANRPRFREFLDGYPAELRQAIRNAVITFLDPKDPDVRSYILRRLNAHFFVEAGNLSEDTVHALTPVRDEPPQFSVFVDTNFLFSILGLHENPSNEAAELLMGIIRQVGDKVRVKLYLSTITVEEAKRVLQACANDLGEVRLSGSLADVALEEGVSGLARKFAAESKRTPQPMTAHEYFRPYIHDLIRVSRHRGVELWNQEVESYKKRQDVVDDVNSRLEFERRSSRVRSKAYEATLHDMVLWHFVRDQRPVGTESPLDSGSWIVTVDFRLLQFDRYKSLRTAGMVRLCLHPANLMQLLQFWIPRTRAFEEAVLDNLRLPFLFTEFDPAAERVTLRILGALSRFEDIGDLPKESITSIVMNNAVRQKLGDEDEVEEQIELVREALVEEHERVKADLGAAQATVADLQRQATESAAAAAEATRKTDEERQTAEELGRQVEEQRQARDRADAQLATAEGVLRAKEQAEQTERVIRRFVLKWVTALLVFVSVTVPAVSAASATLTTWGMWRPAVGTASLLMIIWMWLVDHRGSDDPVVAGWPMFRLLQSIKNALFAPLGLVLLAIIANAAYDWIRTW